MMSLAAVFGLRARLFLASQVPSLQVCVEGVVDEALWFFAAPKKRSTRSRKRMKTWMLGPKPIVHLHHCGDCGKPKLHHKLAPCCVEVAERRTRELKEKRSWDQAAAKAKTDLD
mmetsp:Transcript_11047/g.36533  ORF Transcript_11047/g.36533 Transcript_11047/m.36533 type:complete len:114 (+) Transcript_11047:88-429(+)|eukprot:CAMPEP_0118919602 /NCGR_PEP_ID=MMETSP1166-20130328/18644_1 /TAXON_ID=1104430 /ORGANISM="Chrysoreinhardia sp, Strain CCMP3193" /LENGTH=113 /DNA_ID=CAMNT_0006860133 /DNA_START=20 /DNA_END=361 /DNA_ORIENTATION=-